MLKKSHRDQKVKPLVSKSLQTGCTILEIDVQQACGTLVLGHDWRPKLPFLFDCTFKEYLDQLVAYNLPDKIVLQIDIKQICLTKSSRVKFAKEVVDLLERYRSRMIPLVSANDGLGRPETMKVLHGALLQAGWDVPLWIDWKIDKEIEVVDLWK